MRIFKLTNNEIKKIFKRPTYLILAILILLSSFMMPFANKYFENKYSNTENYYQEDIKKMLESNQIEYEDFLKDKKSDFSDLLYSKANIEVYQFLIKTNIKSYEDYRYEKTLLLTDMILDKYYLEILASKDKAKIKKLEALGVIEKFGEKAYEEYLTKDKTTLYKKLLNQKISKINEYQKAILENNSAYFIDFQINEEVAILNDLNKELASLKKQLKKYPKEAKTITPQIDNINNDIKRQGEVVYYTKFLKENNISLSQKDYKYLLVRQNIDSVNLIYMKPMDKKDFDEQYKDMIQKGKIDYERYLKNFDENIANAKNSIKLNNYAIENNIPPKQFENSTRNHITSAYGFITLVAFFAVILCAGLVSEEFNKGTIKMLLTRSVSRFKILLSKLIAILLIAFVLFALCISLNISSNIIIYGLSDLKIPVLTMLQGEIININMLSRVITVCLKSTPLMLFFISLAFFLTTVFKSSVLAAAIPYLFSFISNIIYLFIMNASQTIQKIFSYTPFLYMNLPYMLNDLYEKNNIAAEIGMNQIEEGFSGVSTFQLNPNVGIIIFLVLSLIFIVSSFIIFTKQDIKT